MFDAQSRNVLEGPHPVMTTMPYNTCGENDIPIK